MVSRMTGAASKRFRPFSGSISARAPAIMVEPETSGASGMVDESALRYYASQKQTARMKAEIARLRRLYPGWSEPADLDSLQPSPPEEARRPQPRPADTRSRGVTVLLATTYSEE